MGRFYKAPKAEFIQDKMFQLPFDQMAQVVQNIDAKVDETEDQNMALYDQLKADALSAQRGDRDKIFEGYRDRIDEISSTISSNPLEYRKNLSKIKSLGREIQTDFTSGDISTIQNNYNALENLRKDSKASVDKNVIRQADFNDYESSLLSNFTNRDAKGNLNTLQTEGLNKFVEVQTLGEALGKGYKADTTSGAGSKIEGAYITSTSGVEEFVKPEVIKKDVNEAILNNQEFNDYYDQKFRLAGITEEEAQIMKEQIADTESDRQASKFGYSKNTIKKDISRGHNPNTGGTGRAKKVEDEKTYTFFSDRNEVKNAAGVTAEGNLINRTSSQESVSQINDNMLEEVKSSKPNASKEDQQDEATLLMSGKLSDEEIKLLGHVPSEVKAKYNTLVSAQASSNQAQAAFDSYEDYKQATNNSGLTYEKWAKDVAKIDAVNELNVDYSLQGFDFTEDERKELGTHLSSIMMQGEIDFVGNQDAVNFLIEEGVLEEGDTSASIKELERAGVISANSKTGTTLKTVQGNVVYTEDDGTKVYGKDKTEREQWTTNIPGVTGFELDPTTIGVSNSYNTQGEITYGMRANVQGGDAIFVQFPISKGGDTRVNAKVASKSKTLRLKDIMAKGAGLPTYSIIKDKVRVLNINGKQSLQIPMGDTGNWQTVPVNQYKEVAEYLFR